MENKTQGLMKHFQDKSKAKNMTFNLIKSQGLSYDHKKALDDIEKSLDRQIKGLEKQLKKECVTMKKYIVNYQNGFEEEVFATNLNEIMDRIEDELNYTQNTIKVLDEHRNDLARLPYYGYDYTIDDNISEDDIVAYFGDFGFYSNWIIF